MFLYSLGLFFFFFFIQGLFSTFDSSIYKSERKELPGVNFVKCAM